MGQAAIDNTFCGMQAAGATEVLCVVQNPQVVILPVGDLKAAVEAAIFSIALHFDLLTEKQGFVERESNRSF